MEEWRPLERYPSYSVSSAGLVRRDIKGLRTGRPGRVLKNSRDRNGYAVVNLRLDGASYKEYVHRLVALAFLGPPPDGHHVAHWDGDGMNASVGNLRWVVQSENEADKRRHGRARYAPPGSRTFSAEQVVDIREALAAGVSARSLGRRFGVTHQTILTAARNGPVDHDFADRPHVSVSPY